MNHTRINISSCGSSGIYVYSMEEENKENANENINEREPFTKEKNQEENLYVHKEEEIYNLSNMSFFSFMKKMVLMPFKMPILRGMFSLLFIALAIVCCIAFSKYTIKANSHSSRLISQFTKKDPNLLSLAKWTFFYEVLSGAIREMYTILFSTYTNEIVRHTGNTLFHGIMHSSMELSSACTTRVVDRGTKSMYSFIQKVLSTLIAKIITIIFLMNEIRRLNHSYFWIIFVSNLLYVIITYFHIRIRIKYKLKMNVLDDMYSNGIMECIRNLTVIICSSTEKKEINKSSKYLGNLLSTRYKDAWVVLSLNIIQKAIYSALILILVLQEYETLGEGAALGSMIFMIITIRKLDKFLMDVALAFKDVSILYIDCKQYILLIDLLKKSTPAHAPVQPINPDEDTIVEFQNVSFSYPTRDRPLFSNLSFSVKKGEKVCIIGKSGCGKSTVLSLILKRYSFEGDILVNGTSIKSLEKAAITKELGIIPQDSGLFTGTIEENILYGTDNVDPYHFNEVIENLSIDQIVRNKKDGYKHVITENGRDLSGGEKQRIAIARALLNSCSTIILDESTSKIDGSTEKSIISYLLSTSCTLIVITHSPQVAEMLDRIISL
ncbi:ATP-binding cassette, subfamily B, heavy metal transporter [Nematocida sp. LUAm3]|nr:ATP-binding cassette, subfamily B, heavy metal transporter [Nematocida sp. LUAm3]KAI5173606.1 ATP-binding cassette, subfamily B, heavy metal transporter [Nematocida sp. LUAm2]KAI5176827.1 ATP-binding cassette, subfamily B, heavy metal transporter [Nematocida sp. LUAm1]